MSCSGCSLLYPLPKMTGLFMSIAFRQEDQRNRSTRSPSRHNLLKLRNQRKSQSQTFAPISPMSSQKRPIMFFPLIDPSITLLNSRIPLSQILRKSTPLTLLNRKPARLSSKNILRPDRLYPPNPHKPPHSSLSQKRMELSIPVKIITTSIATPSAMDILSHSFLS